MPIPPDARQVPGQKNRVELSDGSIVTRATALTIGAQYMGYKSHRDYTKHVSGDAKYVAAWLRTTQGQEAVQKEKAMARAEGRNYSQARVAMRLIGARNTRPNSRTGRAAGSAYLDFMEVYDFDDYGDEAVEY